MTKALFIASIEALESQLQYDINVSNNLEKAFPECYAANLLPKNDIVQKALIAVLKENMDDNESNWIEHFCWELDFGKESFRLPVKENGNIIPMSTPADLYDFLKNRPCMCKAPVKKKNQNVCDSCGRKWKSKNNSK